MILVPQGSRLIGRNDSNMKFGQKRLFIIWDRLVLPDGSSVDLGKVPASDPAGRSGLSGRVDAHGWQLLKGVLLASVLGLGNAIGPKGEGEVARAIRQSGQQNAAQAGQPLVSKELEVQPTVVVRPGWPVRAILQDDLILSPWRGSL